MELLHFSPTIIIIHKFCRLSFDPIKSRNNCCCFNSEKNAEKIAVEYSKTRQGYYFKVNTFFYCDATAPSGPKPPYNRGFMITLRYTTLGRILLDE